MFRFLRKCQAVTSRYNRIEEFLGPHPNFFSHNLVGYYQRQLLTKYSNMGFDNFGELYNYLALNNREELYRKTYIGNTLFLSYNEGGYKWSEVENASLA